MTDEINKLFKSIERQLSNALFVVSKIRCGRYVDIISAKVWMNSLNRIGNLKSKLINYTYTVENDAILFETTLI